MTKTRKDLVLEGLESRLESIAYVDKNLKMISHDKRDYSPFYQEISFYIHYILNTEELNKLFSELMSYLNNLSENELYSESIQNIRKNVKLITTEMLNHSDFDNFKTKQKGQYRNPFSVIPTMEVKDLLMNIKEQDFKQKKPLYSILNLTYEVLARIYSDWNESNLNLTGFEKITNELKLFQDNLDSISFHEDFEYDYLGVKAAYNLIVIYKSQNPKYFFTGSTLAYLQNDLIHKGKGLHSERTLTALTHDCHKIHNYLKQHLTSIQSIEITIDRFATYMALYFRTKLEGNQPEKELQRKFEEFIFQSGYYPISEAQLNDGRLDTLIIDPRNFFLCELKQADLGKNEEKETSIAKKLLNAKIQSELYYDRLNSLPQLSKEVFIILFTNRKISFKNDVDRTTKKKILFIFKSISIYEESPSKIKKEIVFDINDLLI